MATPTRASSLRPEIQGLRAVAVLLVVLYHLWPGRLTGGYIGVDVFFVISGFLITAHLVREVSTEGRVHLAAFWARRVRRLLPAACLVLAATAFAVALWVPRLDWPQFYKEIGASVLYVENWSLAHDSVDYLAQSNNPSPVQHYWTLSAEEQFYIVWPLLILFAIGAARLFRPRRRHRSPRQIKLPYIGAVLGLATAASLAYSLWETSRNPSAAYFITPTRAWEFGAGAMLAILAPGRVEAARNVRAGASWVGLAVLAYCGWTFTDATPMPGIGAIAVVVASLVVLAAGNPAPAWSPTRILSLRPVQFLGDISYSMYLWHWPMIVLLPYALGHHLGFAPRLGILFATVALAWLTKQFVEDPVRTGQRFGLRRSSATLGYAALAAAVLVAVSGFSWHVVEQQQTKDEALAAQLAAHAPRCFGAAERAPGATGCPNPVLAGQLVPSPAAVAKDYPSYPACNKAMATAPLKGCSFGDPGDHSLPHIAVIGDSHARALMPAIQALIDKKLLTADLFMVGGCTWATGPPFIQAKALRTACTTYKRRLEPLLTRTAKNYDFVLTTSWVANMGGSRAAKVQSLVDAWKPVAAQGVPIVALRDNPSAGRSASANPNNCLAKVSVAQANDKCSLDRSKTLDAVFDPYRSAASRTPGAKYIDVSAFYCTASRCPVVIGGVNVYRDNSHVSDTYAKTMAPYYFQKFIDIGVLPRR